MGRLFKVNGFLYFPERELHSAHNLYDYLKWNGKHCAWEMKNIDNPIFEDPTSDLQLFDNEFVPTPFYEKADPDFGDIVIGGIYEHFKGHKVQVLTVAQDTEHPGSYNVIYRHIDTGRVWSRPYEMFCSIVDKEKYPNVKATFRFTLLEGSHE